MNYLVLRSTVNGGAVVVSRHREHAAACKAAHTPGFTTAETGLFVRAIAVNRLGSPVFRPKCGDCVRVDSAYAYPV